MPLLSTPALPEYTVQDKAHSAEELDKLGWKDEELMRRAKGDAGQPARDRRKP
jgi:hypothetical protein